MENTNFVNTFLAYLQQMLSNPVFQLPQDKILLVIAYLGHCARSALASCVVAVWPAFLHLMPTTSRHPPTATAASAIVNTLTAADCAEDCPRRRLECQLDAVTTGGEALAADPQQAHEEQADRQAAEAEEERGSFSANLEQCQQECISLADECQQLQQQGRLSPEPQHSAEELDTLSADLFRATLERNAFADAFKDSHINCYRLSVDLRQSRRDCRSFAKDFKQLQRQGARLSADLTCSLQDRTILLAELETSKKDKHCLLAYLKESQEERDELSDKLRRTKEVCDACVADFWKSQQAYSCLANELTQSQKERNMLADKLQQAPDKLKSLKNMLQVSSVLHGKNLHCT